MNIFQIAGNEFFKVLTGKYQNIFYDCLVIIYNAYRNEISYGTERETLVAYLTDYFESSGSGDIQFEENEEIYKESREKASGMLLKLKKSGWIEYETGNDKNIRIIMPGYSVNMMRAMLEITNMEEMEYQSEISAIFSLLTNEMLLDKPYSQIIKPVYSRTISLFNELKKLNTEIRKYIDTLTDELSPEELMEHFFDYNEKIGSKAYHRMQTNDNISRFRNTIINRIRDMLNDNSVTERIIRGYQEIENVKDKNEAHENVVMLMSDIINYFNSYDDIEKEIAAKHTKYLNSAVNRAKFAFLGTNDIEGKISGILRCLSQSIEKTDIYDDVPDDICRIFNMFPQGFISGKSLRTMPSVKKNTEIKEIYSPLPLSEEEIRKRKEKIRKKNSEHFSRKNINRYVSNILKDKEKIKASGLEISTKRDMIRIIFIGIYGRDRTSPYIIIPDNKEINRNGFSFNDFTIKMRRK